MGSKPQPGEHGSGAWPSPEDERYNRSEAPCRDTKGQRDEQAPTQTSQSFADHRIWLRERCDVITAPLLGSSTWEMWPAALCLHRRRVARAVWCGSTRHTKKQDKPSAKGNHFLREYRFSPHAGVDPGSLQVVQGGAVDTRRKIVPQAVLRRSTGPPPCAAGQKFFCKPISTRKSVSLSPTPMPTPAARIKSAGRSCRAPSSMNWSARPRSESCSRE